MIHTPRNSALLYLSSLTLAQINSLPEKRLDKLLAELNDSETEKLMYSLSRFQSTSTKE